MTNSVKRDLVLAIQNRGNWEFPPRSLVLRLQSRVLIGLAHPIDLRGALQGLRNARADILLADVPLEIGLLHQLRGLFAGAAQKQGASRSLQRVRQVADSAEPGGVDRGHISQAQDNNGWQGVDGMEDVGKLVRGSEKKRSMNPVNNRIVGEVFSLRDVHAAVFDIVFRDGPRRCRSRNAANTHESPQ